MFEQLTQYAPAVTAATSASAPAPNIVPNQGSVEAAANDNVIDNLATEGQAATGPRSARYSPPDPEPGIASLVNKRLRETIGRQLMKARAINGWAQAEAAQLLGHANPSQLSQWESGKRMPPHDALIHVATIFGCSLDYLYGLAADPERDPARGLRAASVNGLRGLLHSIAERLTAEIGRHAALVGPGAVNTRAVLTSGLALLDAALNLQRLNRGFDDLRGGATLVRAAEQFEIGLRDARSAVARFDALDLALRNRLAECAANDPSEGDTSI